MTRDVVYLADHSLLLAIPAFFPAAVIVGVVVYVARRDRRTPDDPDAAELEWSAPADDDGSP